MLLSIFYDAAAQIKHVLISKEKTCRDSAGFIHELEELRRDSRISPQVERIMIMMPIASRSC